jgi:enoyl-CoA hydratase
MASTCFDVETKDKIAHVRLNRPDALNTMTREFWSELPEIINRISDEAAARVIVLSSTGRHFTAGMDIGVFTGGGMGMGGQPEGGGGQTSVEMGRQRANVRLAVLHLQETFSCLEKARMPVIAAVQGGCIGGGIDMISACDMRYATADAFFCIQEINIGITADVGTLQRLPKIIPEGIAREMAFTGMRMPAQRAREVGLVNDIFEDHEALMKGVTEIAATIAERSPLAIWGSKEMINYTRDHSVADSLNYIATWQTGMFQPTDLLESFTAKGEKRDPVYDDLIPPQRKL